MTMAQTAGPAYATQAEFWNSPAARGWADQHERMDRVLAPLLDALLQAAAPRLGERVLDIGCGSGTTTLALAARVGPSGQVLGADIATASVIRADARIAAAGLARAEVIHADASTHAFPSANFDLVCSRLGIMFFTDPTAAFANIRRAIKPDGRAAFIVFRTPAENPWPNGPTAAVRDLLPPLPAPGPEDPGPFSWADPARVHRILEGAGFRDVSLAMLDWTVRLAPPGGAAEAADFMLVFGPLTRILHTQTAETQRAVLARLETYFRDHDSPDGVTLRAANWIVQARA
jgi:SAM-dependent methyltransferase